MVIDEDHNPPLKVIIKQTTLLGEIARSIYVAQAFMQIKGKLGLRPEEPLPKGLEQVSEVCIAQRTWPNCMACLVKSEGLPLAITFEEFCRLPEGFVERWEQAALELNPSWRHVHPTRLRDLMGPPH
jgi:hypothetical protein